MADPGVVDEVLAAGQALQQRLQHLRELLHDMESEFAPLPQQIDTFAWMVEESLPLMRASGPVSSPALTSSDVSSLHLVLCSFCVGVVTSQFSLGSNRRLRCLCRIAAPELEEGSSICRRRAGWGQFSFRLGCEGG